MIMHDMNNNNSNKYYFKYHPMANNHHHRPHHPANMFDTPRNDYFNGPPGYIPPGPMINNNMIPSGGYNHFSNSYPSGGGGPFYRDFRQNWQPQQMISQQQTPHRALVAPTQPTSSNPSVSQGQPSSSSSSSSSTSTSITTSSSTSSSNLINRSSSTTITTIPSSSSSSSRNSRTTDEHTLVKLKQHLAVTQKELLRVTAEKMKLQVEESRLQKIVDKTKLEVDRLESRIRDPRVKNRPDGLSDTSTTSPLDRSISSNFTSTSVASLTSLSTTVTNPIMTNSVPTVSVQNNSNNSNNSINSDTDAYAALFGSPQIIPSHHLQHSTPTTCSVQSSMLMAPLTSISVPNSNNSSNTLNGSLFGTTSLLAPPNRKQNPSSRGKQLNNLVTFKALPLVFDVFPDEILKPEIYTSNQTKIKVNFTFKPNQLELIQRNQQQRVLLRICYVKAKKSSQSDRVSRKLIIKINSRPFPLGKQTNGSIKAPLDITQYCTDLRNELELCWPENEPGRDYGVGIFINQRYSPDHSLTTLKTKDYQRPSCEALKMITKNFAASGDICSEEIMVPLCCPITKKRLEIPAIGIKCEHLACFDAKSFLDITQKRPEWHCPSCKKAIGFNDLRIDCLIVEILSKTPADCNKVSFDRNGSWHPVIENKEKESTPTLIDVNRIDIITLDDSDEENLKGDCDEPSNVAQGEARMELETEQEDDDEDETEQEEEEEEDDEDEDDDDDDNDNDDDEDDDDDDDDDDDEEEEDTEDTEEEGEITERGRTDDCGRCEKSRRYEDDPDFVYSGSRERRKKQFSEIFGSDSRENSPDSSVQSPVNRYRKRRRDGSGKSDKRLTRKNRRRH